MSALDTRVAAVERVAIQIQEARNYGGNATDEGSMLYAQVLATCALAEATLLMVSAAFANLESSAA